MKLLVCLGNPAETRFEVWRKRRQTFKDCKSLVQTREWFALKPLVWSCVEGVARNFLDGKDDRRILDKANRARAPLQCTEFPANNPRGTRRVFLRLVSFAIRERSK